jgi:hypothetical protein
VLRGTALARLGRASTSADISRRLTGRHSMSSAAHTAPARILCSYCCSCRNVFVSHRLSIRTADTNHTFKIQHCGFFDILFDCAVPKMAARRAAPRPRGHRGPAPHRPPADTTAHAARRPARQPHGDGPVAAYAKLAARGELRERPASVARAATHTHHSDPPSASETSEYSTLSPVHSPE